MEQVASLSANGVRIYLLGKSDQYDVECMLLIIQRLYHTNSSEIEDQRLKCSIMSETSITRKCTLPEIEYDIFIAHIVHTFAACHCYVYISNFMSFTFPQ